MDPIAVLSLDFDYFQDVIPEVIQEYPDGIDLPKELSTIVWSTKYAVPKTAEKLRTVKPLVNELQILQELIHKQNPAADVLIASSHLSIYQWIHNKIPSGTAFTLHNVDMHHDLFNSNRNVDCGNWISHIFKDYGRKNVSFRWVVNPITLDVYGFDLNEKQKMEMNISHSLQDIVDQQYQYIFLCRSDNWLPPHLDRHFINTACTICEHFTDGELLVESGILKQRNYQQYVEQIHIR